MRTRRQARNEDWFDEIGSSGAANIEREQSRMRGERLREQWNNRRQQARRWVKRYHPHDYAKRRRLPDGQPKTQRVVSYVRRT